jgi:hypothetical protein
MDLLYPSSHAEARSCPMYVPQDRSRPPGTGSVNPRNYNLGEKKEKSPLFVGVVIGFISCCWIIWETSTTQRRKVSTAGLADGRLSEFLVLRKK